MQSDLPILSLLRTERKQPLSGGGTMPRPLPAMFWIGATSSLAALWSVGPCAHAAAAFGLHSPQRPHPTTGANGALNRRPRPSGFCDDVAPRQRRRPPSSSSPTELHMVFDFFKQRTSEGVEQLGKFTDKAKRGKLSEGLLDVAVYTRQSNEAFSRGLAKSRTKLLYDLDALVNNRGVDVLEELETVLLQSDLGLATTEDVLNEVRSLRESEDQFFSKGDMRSILRGKLLEALDAGGDGVGSGSAIAFADPDATDPREKLTVLFLMGANGMGKTTTIGKLAHRLRVEGGQKVLLAACDTFRAGAVEQLQLWAERAEVECFSPPLDNEARTTSPATVLYGALDRAIEGEFDTLIVDTSGRLSNNDALTAELAKMKRVIQKRLSVGAAVEDGGGGGGGLNESVPHETLLVIDAAQGRMALDSARQWNKEIGLSGLVLTKLDGSAKGGSVVAVSRELQLPVKLVGVGETIDDLKDFEPESFVDGLLGIGEAGGKKGGKATEGKELANRLTQMRKARDERAKTAASASSAAQSARSTPKSMTSAQPPNAPEADDVLVNAGAPAPSRKPPRNKNRSKKRKKGRR